MRRRLLVALTVLVCFLALLAFLLMHYWYLPTYDFVYTDDARIDGAVVSVVAQNLGQVVELPYDVGDKIEKMHPVAKLKVTLIPSTRSPDSPEYIYQNILAPVSGIVADRLVDMGDTISPGQSLLTIIKPDEFWVIANISENDIDRIKPGQRVDIHVDATDETLLGEVEYIIPLTTSIIGRPPGSSVVVAANTQDVPIKIIFDRKDTYLPYLGLSVEVTIHTK